jgi:hypothetical protein
VDQTIDTLRKALFEEALLAAFIILGLPAFVWVNAAELGGFAASPPSPLARPWKGCGLPDRHNAAV